MSETPHGIDGARIDHEEITRPRWQVDVTQIARLTSSIQEVQEALRVNPENRLNRLARGIGELRGAGAEVRTVEAMLVQLVRHGRGHETTEVSDTLSFIPESLTITARSATLQAYRFGEVDRLPSRYSDVFDVYVIEVLTDTLEGTWSYSREVVGPVRSLGRR